MSFGSPTYTAPFGDRSATDRQRMGGKVASLAEMIALGLRVPPGFGVGTAACRLFLESGDAVGALRRELARVDEDGLSAVAGRVAALLAGLPVPDPVASAIRTAYEELAESLGLEDPAVAVRSSAVAEDTSTASFAGEYESYLWVTGPEAVIDSVKLCWLSLFSERAIDYQVRNGIDPAENEMAVAVQLMVDARTAGVMFTLNPISGDPSRLAIEANWGLGISVVNGEVSPDRFLVDKARLEIQERDIGEKAVRYGPPRPPATEIERTAVPEAKRSVSCLSDDEVLELARIGIKMHNAESAAQDIEWAIDDRFESPESIFLLQRRPETIHSQRPRTETPVKGDVTDWISATLIKGRRI